ADRLQFQFQLVELFVSFCYFLGQSILHFRFGFHGILVMGLLAVYPNQSPTRSPICATDVAQTVNHTPLHQLRRLPCPSSPPPHNFSPPPTNSATNSLR